MNRTRKSAEAFLRACCARARALAHQLPTLPHFDVGPGTRPGRYRFVESTRPNWWQLGSRWGDIFAALPETTHFVKAIERSAPFRHSIGKAIVCPGITSIYDAPSVARTLLASYLFANPTSRWRPAVLDQVWSDLCEYFDPQKGRLQYTVYAPIYGIGGIARRRRLSDDLAIERLSAAVVAALAVGLSLGLSQTLPSYLEMRALFLRPHQLPNSG